MEKKINIEDFKVKPGHLSGFANSTVMVSAMGMNLKKIFVFPDGAKISFFNINEKNIKILLSKYENELKPESEINVDITYNKARQGIIYKDDTATLVIGYVDTQGTECPYKIYATNDQKIFATFYFRRQEEIIVNNFKKVVRIYDEFHRLSRLMEKIDKKTTIYKIDPETNGIACEIYEGDVES